MVFRLMDELLDYILLRHMSSHNRLYAVLSVHPGKDGAETLNRPALERQFASSSWHTDEKRFINALLGQEIIGFSCGSSRNGKCRQRQDCPILKECIPENLVFLNFV